jgi:hypothetical protein
MKKYIALIALALSISAHAANPQQDFPQRAKGMDSDVVFAGENSEWKLYFDKNITYETPRKQATVYLLVETKRPRDYTYQEPNGVLKVYKYRYMVQRTDVDCTRGIYVADRSTYFEEGSGKIIQEDVSGMPYKVNRGSLVEIVYRHVCANM